MSYDIHLYRKEVREKQQQSGDPDFWENEENILPFSEIQQNELKDRLLAYEYIIESETEFGLSFGHKNEKDVSVLLGRSALYFSATGEGMFEIGMTSSEFTDSGKYAKYDPQLGTWEEND